MAVVWAAAEREVRELAVVVVEESMVDGDGGGNGNDEKRRGRASLYLIYLIILEIHQREVAARSV